jgi:hypothetical protein
MKSEDMICENCDYYEPWETESPYLVHVRHKDWILAVSGSCRRSPPMMCSTDQLVEVGPSFPFFPSVHKSYWCGEGRWTDAETGTRYYWGDWDE